MRQSESTSVPQTPSQPANNFLAERSIETDEEDRLKRGVFARVLDCIRASATYYGTSDWRSEVIVIGSRIRPSFIVRTHGLIEDEYRSRTGVILRFEEGRALVKADVVDKKIFIRVMGLAEARRRLLAVIRSDFERIHADLKFKPAELVPLHEYPDESVTYDELLVYEQSGIKAFPKVIGKKVIRVDVQELLNGVDLAGTRRCEDRREELVEMLDEPIRIFINYAHKDERFRFALEPHLKLLQRQRLIATWHDRLIKPGSEWKAVYGIR